MPRKKKSAINSRKKVEKWLQSEMERSGKTEDQIIKETFGDGFVVYVEESGGIAKLATSQLFSTKASKEIPVITQCIRLRRSFAPISACIDYLKDKLIGGGVGASIDKPEDTFQKKVKEYITDFIENVYQDTYTHTLSEILDIMVDEALTTGFSAAEAVYAKEGITFEQYASNPIKQEITMKTKTGEKQVNYMVFDLNEPEWKKDKLGGIVRLKIFKDAYKRLKLYRNPQSWEGMYWTVDEPTDESTELTTQGLILASFGKKYKPPVTRLHAWQMFVIALNRKDWTERGTSPITNVLSTALILEKILKSVGEGIWRAGNKKYFIICGTEKRPWSAPHIRNTLQEMEEASKRGWSTIPVPAGFDIKEAGGEVFEAKTAIELFLRIIAKGMQCPVNVVGIDSRGRTEIDYNYQRMRDGLKRAIKFQLFARHVWCEHDKVKQKQGGKGYIPIYIPNVKFLKKGLLSEIDRLKMDVSLLNVANPINPQLKLSVEGDIAEIMGFDDVLLPTQEQLQEELEELEKQMMKKEKKQPLPAGQKAQGEPEAQTLERQLKRQKGMQDNQSQKGKSKPMGGTRIPAERKKIAESVLKNYLTPEQIEALTPEKGAPSPIINIFNLPPTFGKEVQETKVVQEAKQPQPIIIHVPPTDKKEETPKKETPKEAIEMQLLRERLEEKIKKDKAERKNLELQRELTKKELEAINLTIEETKARKEKVEKEIEARRMKLETELEEIMETENLKREEIKKTQKEKRALVKKIRESIEKEETIIAKGKQGGEKQE